MYRTHQNVNLLAADELSKTDLMLGLVDGLFVKIVGLIVGIADGLVVGFSVGLCIE